jgi:NAD(P)H-dependent FMN reductase
MSTSSLKYSPRILLINGSPSARKGNTGMALQIAESFLVGARCETIQLAGADHMEVADRIKNADGLIFGTGTYWDSWGSPLQSFLEAVTSREGEWLGKPAGVVVTAHAVGGKGVLSRLQGVLNTLGCLIPPMGGIVLTLANQLALEHGETPWSVDLWRPSDLEPLCKNLLTAIDTGREWATWPVDREDPSRVWLMKNLGAEDAG